MCARLCTRQPFFVQHLRDPCRAQKGCRACICLLVHGPLHMLVCAADTLHMFVCANHTGAYVYLCSRHPLCARHFCKRCCTFALHMFVCAQPTCICLFVHPGACICLLVQPTPFCRSGLPDTLSALGVPRHHFCAWHGGSSRAWVPLRLMGQTKASAGASGRAAAPSGLRNAR